MGQVLINLVTKQQATALFRLLLSSITNRLWTVNIHRRLVMEARG